MGNFVINANLFFVACILIFAIIVLKSFSIKKKHGRLYASDKRRRGYWITTVCVFVGFLVCCSEILDDMPDRGFISSHDIVYGSATGARVKALKNNTGMEDIQRVSTSDNVNTYFEDDSNEVADPWMIEETEQEDESFSASVSEMTGIPSSWEPLEVKSVQASNSLKKYTPQMLLDGDISTSWQVTVDDVDSFNSDLDLSEWLYFEFDGKKKIDYIVIYNGTPNSEERYFNNGRICEMSLSNLTINPEAENEYLWTDILELRDEPYCQILECNGLNTNEMYLNINKMYPGAKYSELCVSDIMFYSIK